MTSPHHRNITVPTSMAVPADMSVSHYELSVLPTGLYTRPKRPCKYCGRMQTHLSRHILSVHKDERVVVEISEFTHGEKTAAMNRIKKRWYFA